MKQEKGKSVNASVDKLLRLVPLPLLEENRCEADFWKIRFLQVGKTKPEAMVAFLKWRKESRTEANRIAAKLRKMAESEKEPKLSTVKHVGPKKKIVEIVGNSARLFCFYDETRSVMAVIAVESFWIGKGNKNRNQNEAISRAEALMERWEKASPIEGHPDLRHEN